MIDIGTIVSLGALAAQGVILIATFVRTKDKASDAQKEADLANERVTLLRSEFMMYREKVAAEYVSRDLLREFEDRLTKAIDRLGDRLDRAFSANQGS